MKKLITEKSLLNLNKPENLVLESMFVPDDPTIIPKRGENGRYCYVTITEKAFIKVIPVLYYFIHVLLDRLHCEIESLKEYHDDKNYAKMFSRDIEPLKSKNDFRYIRSILVKHKIVEIYCKDEPSKYKKSATSYYFKLTKQYEDAMIIQHQILISKGKSVEVEKRLIKTETNEKVDLQAITGTLQFIHQAEGLKKIMFDSDGAKNYVTVLFNQKLISVGRYNYCMISINRIENNRIYITRSIKCHRIFTTVTGMPRDIRQFIKDHEGNSLVELDYSSFNAFAVYKIANSQKRNFNTNAEKLFFENELSMYRNLLSGGNFYTDFKDVYLSDEILTRDEVKDIILKFWFNGTLTSRDKHKKKLDRKLPNITKVLNEIKADNYKNFSHTTMKMESEIVNDIVYRKFIKLNPNAIMYTIFDCILVEQKYSAQLHTMMVEEGSEYFNLNCMVKAKGINNSMLV